MKYALKSKFPKVINKRKRIIPVPKKKGGFLALLFPILGALGGDAAGIAIAVNDAKANQKQLEEQKRHNTALEATYERKSIKNRKGGGIFLKYPFSKNYQ